MDYSTQPQRPSQNNIYERVTKQIIQSMVRTGQIPWRQTWVNKEKKPLFYNPVTKTKYKLLNRLLLGEPGEYVSFKQAKDHGGKIKPGSKGKLVTYWSDFIPAKDKKLKEELEAKGEDWSYLKKWTLKHYYVFNLNDIEGFKLKSKSDTFGTIETVEAENPVDLADLIAESYRTDHAGERELHVRRRLLCLTLRAAGSFDGKGRPMQQEKRIRSPEGKRNHQQGVPHLRHLFFNDSGINKHRPQGIHRPAESPDPEMGGSHGKRFPPHHQRITQSGGRG